MRYLAGGLAWAVVYFIGRVVAEMLGYGTDVSLEDALSVSIPTVLAMGTAQLIWGPS